MFVREDLIEDKQKYEYTIKKIKLTYDSSNYYKKRIYNNNFEEKFNKQNNTKNHNNNYQEEVLKEPIQFKNSLERSLDESEIITIENFKENLGTYTIKKNNYMELERNKIIFELEKEIHFNNAKIINFKFHISKSIKYIIIVKENLILDENKKNLDNHRIEIRYFNENLNLINNFFIKNEKNEQSTKNNESVHLVDESRRISEYFKDFKIFYNFIYTQFETSIKISPIENFNTYILSCDLKEFLPKKIDDSLDFQEKNIIFKDYIFAYDQKNNYIIVFTEEFDMILFFPIVKFTIEKNKNGNVCNFLKYFKNDLLRKILGITYHEKKLDLNLIYIEIVRNDIIINFNQIGKILFINLDTLEETIEKDYFEFRVFNTNDMMIENDHLNIFNLSDKDKNIFDIKKKYINQNETFRRDYTLRDKRLASEIAFSKNTFSNFILIQNYENPDLIMIFELYNPHSKLVGGDYSFLNFKIPIIFVAMIIIFFYHFFKKRKELNEDNPEIKNEVFKYLEDQGAFKKKFKEENDNPINKKFDSNNKNLFSHQKFDEKGSNLDSNADESINDSIEEYDSDNSQEKDNYKKKIMEFLKTKS